MSVAFSSALSGKKRLFEEHVAEEVAASLGGCGFKRARHLPPLDNSQQQLQLHKQELFLRLTQMFPEVDEKTINAVLENYGENLDAAIESLTQLRLATAQPRAEGPAPEQEQDLPEGQENTDKLSSAWLDHFLGEIYALRQPQEARIRLAQMLQEFEAAAIEHYKNNSEEMMAVKNEFERMRKANLLLSRAVAVQHGKLQEASQKEEKLTQKDQELQGMKEILMNYQERLRILELNNYSLAMHLQRATGSPAGHSDGRPPDVY